MRSSPRIPLERGAVLVTLALIATNLASTGRWAGVPGALRGWRWPYVAVAVGVTAILALLRPKAPGIPPRWLSLAVAGLGATVLAACLLVAWFPPETWPLIPFLDDWPPRFLSTADGVRLLRHGAFSGWEWNLLGGYATATDITQGLTLLGAIPMTLFGDEVGFHLLHIALFCAVPVLVFWDLRRSGAGASAAMASGFVALALAAHGWTLIRSGDTNALAGTFAVLVVLAASRRARSRERLGFTGLVAALSLAVFAHIGFFLYAVGLLVVEALYYRERGHLVRALAAAALAGVVSLPLTYELLRYPGRFLPNNVMYVTPPHIDWPGVVRTVGYNIEILFLPWRWFNDASGLTSMAMPIVLLVAWKREGRAGFYAWCALFAFLLLRFNVPEAGYVFTRPEHLLVIFTPVVLASFVVTQTADPRLATSLALVFVLSFQVAWFKLPHHRSVADFAPDVVARLETLDGNLVVVENNPHRDTAASPGERSERSLYGTHFEALLPAATGKRLYAGYWDGWQWTAARGEMLAGGAWKGRMLSDADEAPFVAELRRWGARHVLVWSAAARSAFGGWPQFQRRWSSGPWQHFELLAQPSDVRSVVIESGEGALVSTSPLEGVVHLAGVRRGARATVRTRFHPAWSVAWKGQSFPVLDDGGQLAFLAPADGTYDVTLIYPARRWAIAISVATLFLLALAESRIGGRSTRSARGRALVR